MPAALFFEPPPMGVAGPSTWQRDTLLRQNLDVDFDAGFGLGRRVHVKRRSTSRTPVYQDFAVISDKGAFNGSCATTQQQSMPIETPEASCSSYYPDITAYCCSGINGTLKSIPYPVQMTSSSLLSSSLSGSSASSTDASSSSSSSSSAAPSASTSTTTQTVEEPVCETSDYADALACFKLTAETNCKSGLSGLYGVCNPVGADTSTVTVSTSGAASLTPWTRGWAGPRSRRTAMGGAEGAKAQGGWKVSAGAGMLACWLAVTLIMAT